MTGNAPNLPAGMEYCDTDACFNIVPGGGTCDECARATEPQAAARVMSLSETLAALDLSHQPSALGDGCHDILDRAGVIFTGTAIQTWAWLRSTGRI